MSQENAVKDVNFDELPKQNKKINYKEVFLSLNEGDNLIRFIDLKGKKIGTHWLKDINGKQRSVKCPVAGCPCCKQNVPTQYKTFMKVVDKLGTIRIFEFGSQIMNQIKRIVADLKEEDPNALLTQRDVIINRGPKGANPLYSVKLVKVNAKPTPSEQLRQQAIEEAISKDDLDLSEIVQPWTVKRINEYIYGIKEDGSPATPGFGADAEDDIFTPGSIANSVNVSTAKPSQITVTTGKPKTDEDLSMFD